MTKKIQRLEDLIPDAANANKGTERGAHMVSQSAFCHVFYCDSSRIVSFRCLYQSVTQGELPNV